MEFIQSTFRSIHRHCCRLPLLALFAFLGASALAAQGDQQPLGEADSEWPGVKFQVMEIRRVDPGHLLVTVRLAATKEAANPTFIGIEPPSGARAAGNRSPEDAAAGKDEPAPFSLREAILFDEATKQKYPALPGLPPQPFLGPNTLLATLRPGGWIQLAVQFPAPPALPRETPGAKEAQRAALLLPKAKAAIKHLPLPALSGDLP